MSIRGNLTLNAFKKLNRLKFKLPFSPTVQAKAIGHGATAPSNKASISVVLVSFG
ncbi:hypothetical protein SAMN05444128_3245 [Pontibacter indicus]|uniref:Uncharacterized protein n=1 Tax=Pontibacter indicus TaxID=1317125 RepID=A0A1R3XQX6_9BACT|nr:hypothetical protein SAMN05444128_3245 [Pontibacter indicus]